MESLKIAFFTDSFLPAHDGVVSSILNFRRELAKRGHEVYIFAPATPQTRAMIKDQKNVILIRGMKFRKYPQYSFALLPFTSASRFDEISPDIVHSHTPIIMGTWALALAKMNKIPIVSTFHTLFTDKYVIQEYATKRAAELIRRYSWKYARFYYNKCTLTMAPSGTIKELLDRKHINNTYVVPNGVDINRFNKKVDGSRIRRKLKKKRDEKIVLYVGRLSREKRIETLIKAAHYLREDNIRIVFAGSGPAANFYTRRAASHASDGNTTFTGFIDDKLLPGYYAAADAFCIPSTFETQGIVSLEAMASGKPVIGANSMALKEIIKNGKNGEKFKPNDSKDCARKIKKVINNIDSYNETVETARNYSVETTTDELLKVYKKAINEVTV
jgi:1,2-diacylglycerol 3-alpha-glucosyltransferase